MEIELLEVVVVAHELERMDQQIDLKQLPSLDPVSNYHIGTERNK